MTAGLEPPSRRRSGSLPPRRRRPRGGRRGASRGRRRWIPLPALLVVVVLAVAGGIAAGIGRGGWMPSAGQSSAQSGGLLDRVEVSGRQGATPVVTVVGSLDVVDAKVREVVTGSGREITPGSPVVLAITAFDGSDGAILSPGGVPRIQAGRADEEELGAELSDRVVGRTEGSRLLFVRRVESSQSDPGGGGIEIDVVDILSSVATGVEEAGEQSEGSRPLTVTLGDDGPIISHGTTPPTGLTTQVLLRGDGAQVGDDDAVVAQFIVTGWSDGAVRSSTWSTGVPQLIDLSTAMPGLRDALVDQRVGSRIAVTIPPDQAAGDDTLCAVVDILGTEPRTGE
ncbi:MAG: peptidylprolyl isomerase [Actinomyces sp.]|nr:peptidylprolyl isomerase [Actinomyces sp.]MCI1641987.1 peptidylprolyl isomerase [Actinomyces sp.]MCI1662985.1 peptidylprolyl isomerase [Actinomyces sp.]MCI1691579.1 peptidylprolyl isomerase [Actinomyces sp.]MCI1788258.1 peptidylprolyl isomerase [Actinomyces sp.]MCI1830622.1 peptidylprolyl isomerase [Actinomyces sp.]